jgi:hypothetical protein
MKKVQKGYGELCVYVTLREKNALSNCIMELGSYLGERLFKQECQGNKTKYIQ